jgi:hypothetical protein
MGRVYNTHGTDDKCIQILNAKMEGRNHFTELGIDGRMVLKWNWKLNMV